ncbi:MAG: hypothetical protein ACK4JY_03795 [Brevundimonas sp.]|uniref:hypothetical protein n=1 Tax=Brevundimonas sp. TaxID=1871086 RepID=UPI00391A11E0
MNDTDFAEAVVADLEALTAALEARTWDGDRPAAFTNLTHSIAFQKSVLRGAYDLAAPAPEDA